MKEWLKKYQVIVILIVIIVVMAILKAKYGYKKEGGGTVETKEMELVE